MPDNERLETGDYLSKAILALLALVPDSEPSPVITISSYHFSLRHNGERVVYIERTENMSGTGLKLLGIGELSNWLATKF